MARGYKDYRRITVSEDQEGKFGVHGTTKLYDDFEDAPLKWLSHNNDLHSEVRHADAAYNGAFGMKICAEQSGVPRAYNHMYRYPPLGERMSLEMSTYWRSQNHSQDARYLFAMGHRTPTSDRFAQIRYQRDTVGGPQEWQIFTSTGYESLPGSEIINPDHWHEITLACNFNTGMYMYVRADSIVFDVGHIELPNGGFPTWAYTYAVVGVEDNAAALTCMHVDDVWIQEL